MRILGCVVWALLVAALMSGGCRADVGDDARKIVDANRDAIVTVQLVVETKMSFSGENEKEERKVSATGTVIDPSGLVVACLSEIDPTKMYNSFMPDGDSSTKFSSEVIDLKFKTDDGTEIPADVILRDADLDLAFLRPKKAPETPMKFVDMSQGATPQLMDETVLLWRMGQVANRSLGACLSRVQAVVTKPRTCFAVDSDHLGCPVFALDGKPVGTVVLRTAKGSGRGGPSYSGMDDIMLIVLPCSTVTKAAEQAKQAQPEKKAEPISEKPKAKPAAKPAAKTPDKGK